MGPGSGLGNDFDSVDFRIFHLGRERDVQFAVGDFDINYFDVSAQRAAGFYPDVEIIEWLALDVEGENALTRTRDAFKRFGKVQFHGVFAVGNRPGERRHAVTLAAIDNRVLGVGDLQVGTINGVAVGKILVHQPRVAGGILEGIRRSGLDPD